MTNKEKYKSVFSQVCTTANIEVEDFKMIKSARMNGKKVFVLAATICLIVAFSVTAFAMNLFGLKDLVLTKDNSEITETPGANGTTEPIVPMELISLQGYSNSKEYQAVAEWMAFRDSYDKDGALLAQVGNGPTGLDEKYSLYTVYTQEMADKLDEIVSKYGLKLHRTIELDLSAEDLYSKAGTGDFLGSGNIDLGIYVYEDGTFHIDGNVTLSTDKQIGYQMMNCTKGSFTDVILNIGNKEDYDEWSYKTASGVTVSLSISSDKSLVFADLDDSFVTINVLAGSGEESGKITASDLEAFADAFDFSVLN